MLYQTSGDTEAWQLLRRELGPTHKCTGLTWLLSVPAIIAGVQVCAFWGGGAGDTLSGQAGPGELLCAGRSGQGEEDGGCRGQAPPAQAACQAPARIQPGQSGALKLAVRSRTIICDLVKRPSVLGVGSGIPQVSTCWLLFATLKGLWGPERCKHSMYLSHESGEHPSVLSIEVLSHAAQLSLA